MTDPAPRYDSSRVHVRGIFYFIAGFFGVSIALLALLWWMEAAMLRREPTSSTVQPVELAQPLQPSPGHEQLPWQDLARLRQTQMQKLHSFGPLSASPAPGGAASPSAAYVHIPIERAIDLLLSSGELQKSWVNPTTHPYQLETQPSPKIKPSVENRS